MVSSGSHRAAQPVSPELTRRHSGRYSREIGADAAGPDLPVLRPHPPRPDARWRPAARSSDRSRPHWAVCPGCAGDRRRTESHRKVESGPPPIGQAHAAPTRPAAPGRRRAAPAVGFVTPIQRVQRLVDGLGFIVRRGHVGTIRPGVMQDCLRGPGSRGSGATRHSGRRCTRRGIYRAPRGGRRPCDRKAVDVTTHLRARALQAGAFLALIGGVIAAAPSPAMALATRP